MRLPMSIWNLVFLSIGIFLTILGVAGIIGFPYIIDGILAGALKFGPDTLAFQKWEKPLVPINMEIYFFNWTNPEDIYNPDVKPIFEEVGPYKYIQYKEKVDVVWNPENGTITYRYLKNFYFDRENSPRSDSDIITTINMVALTAADMADDWSFVFKQTVKFTLSSSEIFVRKNVSELMFDGYRDKVLATASAIPFLSNSKVDRFGWFYGKNNSIGNDGVFNMATDAGSNFATLQNWNYRNRTSFYEDECGIISGSAGELYPRNAKPDYITFFSPDMCRTLPFKFEKQVDVKGIPCYKFSAGDEVFDNGTKIKENTCFCKKTCYPSGVLNVSPCREDAPLFLSLPHFYNADPSYVDAVEGMYPEKKKHEMYITLEPNTGLIADISARMQVNVLLRPILDFPLFENAPEVMFPVFWFNQRVIMNDEVASSLTMLFKLPNITKFVCAIIIVLGLLSIVSVLLFVTCYKAKNTKGQIITKEEIPLKSKPR